MLLWDTRPGVAPRRKAKGLSTPLHCDGREALPQLPYPWVRPHFRHQMLCGANTVPLHHGDSDDDAADGGRTYMPALRWALQHTA